MSRRQFIVPAASALGLSLTAACSDPIIGEWQLTSLGYVGEQASEYPYTYTSTYDGTTISSTIDYRLTIDKELAGEFVGIYTYTKGTDTPEVYEYAYALTATRSKKTYAISITGYDIDLSCTIDKTALDCEQTNGEEDPYTMGFEKV